MRRAVKGRWGLVVVMVALVLAACGGSPRSPYFDDERYLRFGVDPFEEADALAQQFEQSGQRVALELRGQHFSAFGTVDAEGRAAVVRVVTARGVTLALDSRAPSALEAGLEYRLVRPPRTDTQDLDGDGFEEVLIERRSGVPSQVCLELHRVRDVGFVDAVPLPELALGEPGCVEAVRDVDGDGRAELLLVARLRSLGRSGVRAPELPLVLWATEHRFEVRPPEGGLAAELLAARQGGLDLARSRGDADSIYRFAIELALLAALSGADGPGRVAELNKHLGDALAGSDSVVRARAFFEAGLPPLAEWPPEAPGSPAAP